MKGIYIEKYIEKYVEKFIEKFIEKYIEKFIEKYIEKFRDGREVFSYRWEIFDGIVYLAGTGSFSWGDNFFWREDGRCPANQGWSVIC